MPIVNKRISVTPVALIAGAVRDPLPIARALDRAARETGVNFIGGYSALVQKGMTGADRRLINSLPQALSETDFLCGSVNVATTRAGIDMDAVKLLGESIVALAEKTGEQGGLGCAKLVVFANAVEDTPSWRGPSTDSGRGTAPSTWGSAAPAR